MGLMGAQRGSLKGLTKWHLGMRSFRQRRLDYFFSRFAVDASTTILDIGGTHSFWEAASVTPSVVVLNISPPASQVPGRVPWVIGDARELPFKDDAVDVAFSNSVIEHVGAASDQARFAQECRRVGQGYFVQTPNVGFPIEPHYLAPFVHWMPPRVRPWFVRLSPWAWRAGADLNQARARVDEIRLLGRRELLRHFDDGALVREKFMGFTKSFMISGPAPLHESQL